MNRFDWERRERLLETLRAEKVDVNQMRATRELLEIVVRRTEVRRRGS